MATKRDRVREILKKRKAETPSAPADDTVAQPDKSDEMSPERTEHYTWKDDDLVFD